MFEVPEAKRIRREDLYDSASDEETAEANQPDPSLQQKLNEQLCGLLDLGFTADEAIETHQEPESTEAQTGDADASKTSGVEGEVEETGEEAFTFRLFRGEDPSHKVVLEPQDGARSKGDGAFVVAKRPMSYYLTEEPSPETADEFRRAAVSAEYLLQDAGKRRWGLEKPWKVTTITITTKKQKSAPNRHGNDDSTAATKKKKRPGKKRRIILRVREKAKKEREEAAKRQAVDKKEHLKEKKKRLNRQKKLKRRAKEREMKQGAKGDAASVSSSRDGSPEQE
ncbi:hypothetical protein GGR53DRAFT_495412 [Hypoxylon sp. FL1150]|nr:hypothetical protein GGR53DRAFT_495412 [Hypoxylon sp. FL1150]